MRYRCLVLDHDDTVVKSTPSIHYPSFVEALEVLRPEREPLSIEEFISYCFNPGFSELCREIMAFTQEEQAVQYNIWKKHVREKIPEFYEGFPELIKAFKAAGGIVTVVSHSESEQIMRDYQLTCQLVPDLIFGWELPEHQRKPSSYPIIEIMKRYDLKCDEILVVDDLKPGLDMAKKCGVPFAAAGWSHSVPDVITYMKKNADYYFPSVEILRQFVLSDVK